ncbi:MAG: hypothetical protein IKY78_06120 [Clostridia bacterium]|nr:hypothetical protein [Clostridia bacterium]
MKKNIGLLIIALLLCTLLTACGHQHKWNEATCKAPKTCEGCGATEGTVTDHSWKDADCETPKTCVDCGITEGTAPGHNWNDATCQEPQSCTECGATEGAALPHDYSQWGEAKQDSSGKWIFSRSCSYCGDVQTEETDGPGMRWDHGSAGYVEGTTLIVSVFADDVGTAWDFTTEEDCATRDLVLTNLESATTWLNRQIGVYGVEANFIFDWEANPDLYYTYDFEDMYLIRDDVGVNKVQEEYIMNNIPTEKLKEKYQVEDIIYMFYFNTDENSDVSSCAACDIVNKKTETISIFVRNANSNGFDYVSAATLAHEIMHCFGAYDLYYASETIPQEYVDYCKRTASMDIMHSTNRGSTVLHLFTPLSAYYMGLIDSCDEATDWGLGKSTFSD